jgi:hypothetical protein
MRGANGGLNMTTLPFPPESVNGDAADLPPVIRHA